jgi:hypothetical protein
MQPRTTAFVTAQIGIPLTAHPPCISAERRAPFADSTICCSARRRRPSAYLSRTAAGLPEVPPEHLARRLGSPDMPARFVHPFWIESLNEATSEITDARLVAAGVVATPKGPPTANGHLRRLAIPVRRRFVIRRPSDTSVTSSSSAAPSTIPVIPAAATRCWLEARLRVGR